MKRGERAGRVVAALRALRADLWTTALDDPLPGTAQRPRWLDWRPAIVVPLAVCALVLLAGLTNRYLSDYGLGMPLAFLLASVSSAALVVVLFRPVLAWWASTVSMAAATVVAAVSATPRPFPPFALTDAQPWAGPQLTLQAGVLFLLALRVRPRIAAETLALTVLAGPACGLVTAGHLDNPVVPITVLAVSVLVGTLLRGRQVARTELVAQEELTAEERARRTLLEERQRIARELHDVVAHHMSVISIQAQVAPHLADNPSDELKDNLTGIRQNAVDALTELRRVLGVLRAEDPLPASARHAPQPTLDHLDDLIANVRAAGLTVTAHATGDPRQLPPGLELSAFRIVQEALSNAMRHAPGARVRVDIGHHPTSLTVRIANTAPDRPVPPSPGTGHGLLGMRERTAMLGGDLATGPSPDGGYEVTAVLPTTPPAAEVPL
ncbi:sensor histidine kinase [Streptomyces gilvosporeus]|uniref:histidine kinase n=1 Tax=Streptomyces gilvosporeus TaxID=553510 RepID=A0A1V0U3V9_9ACTN|nr:sensor histidine kinase [Streptomyces gilvosporeus]ARF59863.1 two-component sensor histidine kinase [Streptomyces gilvosporeus]